MELVSLQKMPKEAKLSLLKKLGFNSDGKFVLNSNGKKVKDPYINEEVLLSNMLIFPGSTIILDNNPLSIALYMEEHGNLDWLIILMPEENKILENAAKGATKGVLEYSEEKIKSLVRRFLDGDLAFIEDEKTIQIVRSQRKKPEWKLYRNYIIDPDLRMQIEMGFSLKQLEDDRRKLQNLRTKIIQKYGKKGLHIAQLAQSGVVGRYIGILIGRVADENELKENIEEVLKDVDKYVVFLKTTSDTEKIADTVLTKIKAFSPRTIILFSCGNAVKKANKVIKTVKKEIEGYQFEEQFEQNTRHRYDFILKEPVEYFVPI